MKKKKEIKRKSTHKTSNAHVKQIINSCRLQCYQPEIKEQISNTRSKLPFQKLKFPHARIEIRQ